MTKPTVFNYQEYLDLLNIISEREAEILDLTEENDRLKEKVANLGIRCRIAEEALTESQKKLLNLAMDRNLLQLTIDRTWIPVDEKLPADSKKPVIVSGWHEGLNYYGIDIARYSHGSWLTGGVPFSDLVKIMAWMPLPEPYK